MARLPFRWYLRSVAWDLNRDSRFEISWCQGNGMAVPYQHPCPKISIRAVIAAQARGTVQHSIPSDHSSFFVLNSIEALQTLPATVCTTRHRILSGCISFPRRYVTVLPSAPCSKAASTAEHRIASLGFQLCKRNWRGAPLGETKERGKPLRIGNCNWRLTC